MRLNRAHFCALLILACAPAQAAVITADASYSGGIFGSFSITFTSDSPTVQLAGVDFNLLTGVGGGPGLSLFLDPTGASPGYLANQNFTPTGGAAATGFLGTSGISDGSTAFALTFGGFNPGESFTFDLDVDHYVNLVNCASLPTLAQRIACGVANGLRQTDGSIVDASEFAGTEVTFHFLTPFGPRDVTTEINRTGFLENGGTAALVANPEPGTWMLMISGLGILIWRARRRTLSTQFSRLR